MTKTNDRSWYLTSFKVPQMIETNEYLEALAEAYAREAAAKGAYWLSVEAAYEASKGASK